jgi:hypothetical protein
MIAKDKSYPRFYANSEEIEATEPICRHCGKPKDRILSEEDFSYRFVCPRCNSSASENLSVWKIKDVTYDSTD